jgi:hypothetical protein
MQRGLFARSCRFALLIGLSTILMGCATTQYQGLEPSARTFHGDDAGPQDYYIGADLDFVVDTPQPHVPASHEFDDVH